MAAPADEPLPQVMTASARKTLSTEGGAQFELLSRTLDVPFEFILNTWPPGTSTGTEMYHHEGLECGLVLEGELEVEVNGNIYPIKPGDTITLCSSLSHRISNVGKKKAIAVWVNSVPWLFTTK